MDNIYYKKDKLSQLRGFCAMVKADSLIDASKKMHVQPPTISKQIRSLERDIQIKLFKQKLPSKKLILTNEGVLFYEKATSVLDAVDSLYKELPEFIKEKSENVIRMAVHHTVLSYLIPNYIKRYKDFNANTTFNIKNLSFIDSMCELENDKVDFVIHVVSDNIPSKFKSITLFEFKPVLLMHKDNSLNMVRGKITFKDLEKQNMIMLDKDSIVSIFIQLCRKRNISGNINIDNCDWETAKSFVKLNLGVHLYNEIYNVFDDDKDLVARNVDYLFPGVKFQLIYKNGKIFNKFVEHFINIIKNFNVQEEITGKINTAS